MLGRIDRIILLLQTANDHLGSHGNAHVKSPSWHRSSPAGFGAVEKMACPNCKGARRVRYGTEPCHKCLVGDRSNDHRCSHCPQCFDVKLKRGRGWVMVDPYDVNREPVLSEPDDGTLAPAMGRGPMGNLGLASGSESIRRLDKDDFPGVLCEGREEHDDSGGQTDTERRLGEAEDVRLTTVAGDVAEVRGEIDSRGCPVRSSSLQGGAVYRKVEPQETKNPLAQQNRVLVTQLALSKRQARVGEVWERERATRDRRGSYVELERALESLRMTSPLHSSLVHRVYIDGDVRECDVDSANQWHLHYALEWLSENMPAEIRCPQELLDQTVAADRVATVTELHAQGMSAPKIAKQLGMQLIKVKKALKRAA